MHPIEVKGIADGEVAKGILGCNPIATGEVDEEEIRCCEKNPIRMPSLIKFNKKLVPKKQSRSATYTPVARRRAKPDAVLWLLKYCPELEHSQIVSLVSTTLGTVRAIADGSYWNMNNLRPRDPVLLRLCSREDLEDATLKAKVSSSQEENYKKALQDESDADAS